MAHTFRHRSFHAAQAFNLHFEGFDSTFYCLLHWENHPSTQFILTLVTTMYATSVAEIKDPAKNIPRSFLMSITGIAILYLGMQTMILGVIPWQTVAGSDFVASIYFEHIYNSHFVGQLATFLILVIALASLFLRHSRVFPHTLCGGSKW